MATSTNNNNKTEGAFALKSINFECHQGDFVAVVGGVGSGKTSLLKAILGELQKASGTVEVGRKDVSYFNQNPFIMNDTVKGNIVFGRSNEDIDEELYQSNHRAWNMTSKCLRMAIRLKLAKKELI